MELQKLQERIEAAREKLHFLTEKHHGQLSHPYVIRQSVRLDKLINEYNQYYFISKYAEQKCLRPARRD